MATEELFWKHVRNRKLGGFKFKRQFPIDPYIVDFVCLEQKLIVELDGSLHDQRIGYDEVRDHYLKRAGFRVLRFDNGEVVEYLSTVLAAIRHALRTPSPQPSPPLRGGEGDSHWKQT